MDVGDPIWFYIPAGSNESGHAVAERWSGGAEVALLLNQRFWGYWPRLDRSDDAR